MSIESLETMVRSRVRMFLRHTLLVTVLATLLFGGLIWATIYYTTASNHMRIAAAPVDAPFVKALSDALAKSHHDLSLKYEPTSSTEETVAMMTQGKTDLAIIPAETNDSVDWPVVAILRQNVMALIIPAPGAAKRGKKTGKIEAIDQLAGRRIGLVGGDADERLLGIVLGHYGVPLSKVTLSQIEPKNLASAVKLNQVDALFVVGPATGRVIADAVAAATVNGDAPHFLAIDQADGIAKRNPGFDSVDIDAGTFGGKPPSPDDDLKSLTYPQYLVARKNYSDTVIALLSRVIYTSRQSLASALPGEMKITAPSTDKDADAIVHPGTLAYLNDSQQSFFDKYGDDIFYGMLIFPVFGSAIAGVASYLRNDTRTRRLRLLQRVLDLVRKAHGARTLEAIESLQIEADNLVVAIIHQSEQEEFEETLRMSFAFALDQLRFAIAARRTAILDHAHAPPPALTASVAAALDAQCDSTAPTAIGPAPAGTASDGPPEDTAGSTSDEPPNKKAAAA